MPILRAPGRAPCPARAVSLLAVAVLLAACRTGGVPDAGTPATNDPAASEETRADSVARATLDEAEGLIEGGQTRAALERLLSLPPSAPDPVLSRAVDHARDLAAVLDTDALGELLQATPPGQPAAVPVMVAYARGLILSGDEAEARRYAEAALGSTWTGPDSAAVGALLDNRVEPIDGREPVIGALLPSGGSPALQRYATEIEEGVRVAVEGPDAPTGLRLALRSVGAEPTSAGAALSGLGTEPVLGVVGPLRAEALADAAIARAGGPLDGVPLVSPTSPEIRVDGPVLTLGSADPGAARALARYAAGSGLRQVVVLHPIGPEAGNADREAEAFQQAFLEQGGSVLRTLTYRAGTTYFQEQLEQVRALQPDALVLPVGPEDVLALAPQVSFFGLDTLGIRVLGTADWGSPEVVSELSPRHINGVIVATPRPPGEARSEGEARFVQAYETFFQRSLDSPLPALGYDAASLLVLAARSGARTAAEMTSALERIRNFEGATGRISVEDGRIVREHHLACVQNGRLLEVRPGQVSIGIQPSRQGNPARGEPARVRTGPFEVRCPGLPLPGDPGAPGDTWR